MDAINYIYELAWWYITQPWVWAFAYISIFFDLTIICVFNRYAQHGQQRRGDDDRTLP